MPEMMYVRLKPYNPRRGFKIRRFMVFGDRYEEGRGWYRVTSDKAAYLSTVKQDNNNPDSPPAFDVCTEDQYREITRREYEEEMRQGRRPMPIGGFAGLPEDKTDQRKQRQELAAQLRAAPKAENVGAGDPGSLTTSDFPRPDPYEIQEEPPAAAEIVTDDLPPLPEDHPQPVSDQQGAGEDLQSPSEDLPQVTSNPESKPDDLTAISGIGESTASKLVASGFATFEAIAKADLGKLESIVGSKAKSFQKKARSLAGS